MEKLVEYFKDKALKTVLDVGTGKGDFIAVLKEAMPGSKITGVDPSTESIEEAAKNYPEVTFKEMVGEKLLFPDNTFDVVAISMALHHLPDIQKTLGEMKRVLKPAGWFVVNELFSDNLNAAQQVHKQYHHFRSTIDRLLGVSHNSTFTKQEILDIVSSAGIEIQLDFEITKKGSLIKTPEDIQERVDRMKLMLEKVKDRSEYEELKSEIEDFSQNAKQFGFEMATRVVIVGAVK